MAAHNDRFEVPIRGPQWGNVMIGVASAISSLLVAGILVSPLLLVSSLDGAVILIIGAALWMGGFFLSVPWQRRIARSQDARRPGIVLTTDTLTVPLPSTTLSIDLRRPYEIHAGWLDRTQGSGAQRTRVLLTYARISQDEHHVVLAADDSVEPAKQAHWREGVDQVTSVPHVRLWAADLVALVDALRTSSTPQNTQDTER